MREASWHHIIDNKINLWISWEMPPSPRVRVWQQLSNVPDASPSYAESWLNPGVKFQTKYGERYEFVLDDNCELFQLGAHEGRAQVPHLFENI